MENNFDAWAVWGEIQTQFRAGPMGILGLDYSEMRQAIRDFGLTRTRSLEKKIKALEKEKLIHGNSRSK